MNSKQLRTLLTMFILCLSMASFAVPAKHGIRRMIKLIDGSQIEATLHGDEWGSYWEASNGLCYHAIDTTGIFQIADKNAIIKRATELRIKANSSRIDKQQNVRTRASIGGDHIPYTGIKRGVIVLVQFADKKFNFIHNRTYYDRVANGPLSDAQKTIGFQGTMKDYFLTQSNGKFELVFDVVGPYTLKNGYAYYGAHTSTSNDIRPGEMIAEAVKLADADIDYQQYDWDGNGYVDQVSIVFAGPGEAAGGDENTIWPHEWTLSSAIGNVVNLDNVGINRYSCSSELTYSQFGSVTQVAGVGTMCHEFSHCLGLPDLYDTAYKNSGMGQWDLMDQGNYNGNEFLPPNYSIWEKWYAGWMEPVELKSATTVQNVPAPDINYGQSFVIYNDAHKDEYYLLENRQNNVGIWDRGLPSSGLMIMHVDYNKDVWENNLVNNSTSNPSINDHQRAYLFRADNKDGIKDGNGDLYPFNGNNSLTDTSTPAAIIFNNGTLMGKPITNITQNADGTVSFDFMGGSSSNVVNGIETLRVHNKLNSDAIYTLDGRYAGNNLDRLEHGIYVVGGKKVVK